MGNPASALVNRAQRFPLNVALHYRKSGMPHWQDGKTVNISRTGILFEADEVLPKDSVLDIQVSLPLKVSISCQATVVRSDESRYAVRIHRHHLIRH